MGHTKVKSIGQKNDVVTAIPVVCHPQAGMRSHRLRLGSSKYRRASAGTTRANGLFAQLP